MDLNMGADIEMNWMEGQETEWQKSKLFVSWDFSEPDQHLSG